MIDGLVKKHALVRGHDPYVAAESAKLSSPKAKVSSLILETTRGADCIVIATDHPEFVRMNLTALARVVRMPAAFVDGRCQFEPKDVTNAEFVYRGIGRPYSKPVAKARNLRLGKRSDT